jgi:hypothetical protein
LINVYMPHEDNDVKSEEFNNELVVIADLLGQHSDCHVIIGGDFNVDFSRSWLHTSLLEQFCRDNDLFPTIRHENSSVDYTYQFDMDKFKILDHFIVSELIYDTSVNSLYVHHDIDNLSDHEVLVMTLKFELRRYSQSSRAFVRKPAWHKATEGDLLRYRQQLSTRLQGIALPVESLLCRDVHCSDSNHFMLLEKYSCSIVDACLTAARTTIPLTGLPECRNSKCVPGWVDMVEPARQTSMFWHNMWVSCGRPRDGEVAAIMRRTRAAYHYAVRDIKRNTEDIVKQKFAEAVLQNKDRDLWNEVHKIRGKRLCCSSSVDDCYTDSNIANLFYQKYEDLYTSVPYNIDDMNTYRVNLQESIDGYSKDCIVTYNDVVTAVNRLKWHKSDGNKGLSSDHVKRACLELSVHIALLITGMLIHGFVPNDLLVSTVIPIPKGKNTNVTVSSNYRGIALSSIIGKVIDLILLDRYYDKLVTSDLQFGFKEKRSTTMCSMILKESIEYYMTNGSGVYCIMLDATKAFDRVEYFKLFKLLMERKISPIAIRILLNMYTNHSVRVSWNGVFSDCFTGMNGTKQGGVLSPILFSIYLDGLLCELQRGGVGCCIGRMFVGGLAYADDVALIAPTPDAMRKMLNICDKFAAEFSIVFNAKKSKCLVFQPKRGGITIPSSPSFYIGGNVIEIVDKWPHLGHIITSECNDEADILNRRNSLINQINQVLCYFKHLSSPVKMKLLAVYCSSLYGSELWNLCDRKIEDICVVWRKGLRRAWSLPPNTHNALLAPLCNTIPIMDEICRRFLSFAFSCLYNDSEIVAGVAKYALFYARTFSTMGRNNLFCYNRYWPASYFWTERPCLGPCEIRRIVMTQVADATSQRVKSLHELIMVRDDHLCVPGFYLNRNDIDAMISVICTDSHTYL